MSHTPKITVSVNCMTMFWQLSVAVKTSASGMLSHSTVRSAASAATSSTNKGAVVSTTSMVCTRGSVALPHWSVAVNVRTNV